MATNEPCCPGNGLAANNQTHELVVESKSSAENIQVNPIPVQDQMDSAKLQSCSSDPMLARLSSFSNSSPHTLRRARFTKEAASVDVISDSSPVSDQTRRFYSVVESETEKSRVKITSDALQSKCQMMELQNLADRVCSQDSDLAKAVSALVPILKASISLMKSKFLDDKLEGLNQAEILIEKGWSCFGFGRDLTYELCDVLRKEGGLDELIKSCDDETLPYEIQSKAAHLLSRTLTVSNRDHLAKVNALQRIVNWALNVQKDRTFCRVAIAILECLFKHSKNTCLLLIKMGGLDVILFSCRSLDIPILRYCSKALANLSIYGGHLCRCEMIKCNTPEWLFPMAFAEDDSTRYYALLAIATLCTSKEAEIAVVRSGTLELVEPFLQTHNPLEFGNYDPEHIHGQSKEWLSRLLRFLPSRREEAQSLIAFHFAMEAGICKEQNKLKLFREIGAITPLKRLASSRSKLSSRFASQALRIMGEDLPNKLSPRVPLWTNENVVCWIHQLGFSEEIVNAFKECQVDGDLLLLLTEENLSNDIGIQNGIIRNRFVRELNELRQTADYHSIDSSHLNDWLYRIAPEFRRYTYRMLKSRVSLKVLPKLKDEHLLKDCGVLSGVHRLLILETAKSIPNDASSSLSSPVTCESKKNIDVFISYRRNNGSMLASLIKVYLQILGYSVFIDIEKLPVGKFDENLLRSIGKSRCFIIVLTSHALDRCLGDNQCNDWIHKEVAAAIKSKCQIIPIIDNFDWPQKELLPEDMREIVSYNGIVWSHDLQDACINRLCGFLDTSNNSNGRPCDADV